MSESVIAARAANALIEDAEVPLAGVVGLVPGLKSVESVLGAFKKAYGGLWVGGRTTLTASDVRFRANAANRALHRGTMELVVPLSAIVDVAVRPGFVTRIVAFRPSDLSSSSDASVPPLSRIRYGQQAVSLTIDPAEGPQRPLCTEHAVSPKRRRQPTRRRRR